MDSFRGLLKKEREKIKSWHRAGAGGREIIQAHTGLIDEVIRYVVDSLVNLEHYAGVPVLEKFALVAVGGYGRGELNPFSDIDLLFIQDKKIDPAAEAFIQDLITILWGFGLDIGHSCRTVKDCLALGKEDLTIQTSMIEMRYLIGQQLLFEELERTLGKNVLKKNIQEFLRSQLSRHSVRNGSVSELVCTPEPDIKNGAGGLRDYHTALWGVASRFGSLSFMEAGDDEAISESELQSFSRSVDFFLQVRNELHYLMGKKSDVLRLGIQFDLAANLGYRKDAGADPVERFMQDYYLHATNIYNVSEIICRRCLQKGGAIKKVIATLKKKALGNGFYALKSALHFQGSVEECFLQNKALFLDLFSLCRAHDLELDPQLKRQIRLNRRLLDDAFLKEKKVSDFLNSLLDHPDSGKTLRLMHEAGVLGQILPEFGHTHCLLKYDFYHRYTADEHSLRMVWFLEYLDDTEEKDLLELSRIFKASPCKRLLKLAALLRSMGKDPAQPVQGTDEGPLAVMAERLRLEEEDKQTLRFLLDNFYEMTEIAFHQEIQHLSTIQAFARRVGSIERLDLIYLMSYAELKAVAPDTWTSWKKFLLHELYHHTKDYLEQPESQHKKSLSTRFEVYQKLHQDFFTWEIEDHLDLMPDDYRMSAPPDAVALHIRLLRAMKKNWFILHTGYNEAGAYHNLTLCSQKNENAFTCLVGILTAQNMNILGAQIFLRQDGVIITTLQVERAAKADDEGDAVWAKVNQDLQDVLENRKQMRALLAARKRYVVPKNHPLAVVPKIQIDNTADPAYTIIRVEARDHLGMLYKIVRTLFDFGIQIHCAKISCQGDRGIDVFYVSLRGAKIVFKRLTREIKERLINVLLIENVEDAG